MSFKLANTSSFNSLWADIDDILAHERDLKSNRYEVTMTDGSPPTTLSGWRNLCANVRECYVVTGQTIERACCLTRKGCLFISAAIVIIVLMSLIETRLKLAHQRVDVGVTPSAESQDSVPLV